MRHRIVVLGAGTGGTLTANRLRRLYGEQAEIVVVDRDDRPRLPAGPALRARSASSGPRTSSARAASSCTTGSSSGSPRWTGSRPPPNTVHLADGVRARLRRAGDRQRRLAALRGDRGPARRPAGARASSPSTRVEDAVALRDALRRLRARPARREPDRHADQMPGRAARVLLPRRLVPARARGPRPRSRSPTRRRSTPPSPSRSPPSTSAACSSEKEIALETEFATGRVDGEPAASWSAGTSARSPSTCWSRSRCTAAPRSSPARPASATSSASSPSTSTRCRARPPPNVFAIGDAASLPTSKAGSSTHFEGETLCANVERRLAGEELEGSYDGHVNCFIESGFHKALLIDFNYEVEPLPGRYPEPHLGPLPLLRESRLNHLGKLAFQPLYWHMLLPGRDIPGVGAEMSMAGKQTTASDKEETDEHRHLRRHAGRGRRRGLPDRPEPVERAGRRRDRRRGRDRGADRPPLAGRQLHARHLPGVRLGALDPHPRQSLRASRSRSCTSCSRKGRRSWPPRSPASRSRAAASRRKR